MECEKQNQHPKHFARMNNCHTKNPRTTSTLQESNSIYAGAAAARAIMAVSCESEKCFASSPYLYSIGEGNIKGHGTGLPPKTAISAYTSISSIKF
jgi:hypothetical protein